VIISSWSRKVGEGRLTPPASPASPLATDFLGGMVIIGSYSCGMLRKVGVFGSNDIRAREKKSSGKDILRD
jgi:hypothetical protein